MLSTPVISSYAPPPPLKKKIIIIIITNHTHYLFVPPCYLACAFILIILFLISGVIDNHVKWSNGQIIIIIKKCDSPVISQWKNFFY